MKKKYSRQRLTEELLKDFSGESTYVYYAFEGDQYYGAAECVDLKKSSLCITFTWMVKVTVHDCIEPVRVNVSASNNGGSVKKRSFILVRDTIREHYPMQFELRSQRCKVAEDELMVEIDGQLRFWKNPIRRKILEDKLALVRANSYTPP